MEREFIKWLKSQSLLFGPGVQIGVGDDAAVVSADAFHGEHLSGVVVSTDAVTHGTHFNYPQHSLELIGRKAMAVNLSDMAAMAAHPVAAVVSYTAPRDLGLPNMKELFLGSLQLASEFGFSIVGGDTNCSNGPLTIAITILGKPMAGNIWRINGARAGDYVFVSGTLGGSILGHHLTFRPRLELAKFLANNYSIHSATDVTDSLSLDLQSLADASSLGASIDLEAIPISDDAIACSKQTGKSAIDHALSDGEDFELLFTLPAEIGDRLLNDPKVPDSICKIGEMIDTPGLWSKIDGQLVPIEISGYSH